MINADSTLKHTYRLRCYCFVLVIITGHDDITTNCGNSTYSDPMLVQLDMDLVPLLFAMVIK